MDTCLIVKLLLLAIKVNFMLSLIQKAFFIPLPIQRNSFKVYTNGQNLRYSSILVEGSFIGNMVFYGSKKYRSPITPIALSAQAARLCQRNQRHAFPFYYKRHHFQTRSLSLPFLSKQLQSLRSFSIKTDIQNEISSSSSILYDELKAISSEIRYHDDLYYNKNQPILTDDEYDALAAREEEICISFPELLYQLQNESEYGSSVTRYGGRVGSTIQSNKIAAIKTTEKSNDSSVSKLSVVKTSIKRKHIYPMLSLDNVHSTDQLKSWLLRVAKKLVLNNESSITILTEPKLDGLSLTIRYKKDENLQANKYNLQWACTRGDGQQGTDVTQSVMKANLAPLTLFVNNSTFSLSNEFEIRGEVVFPLSEFRKINSTDDETSRFPIDTLSDINATMPSANGTIKETTAESIRKISLFSNARNAASGMLLRKQSQKDEGSDTSESDQNIETNDMDDLPRKLRFYAYDLVVPDLFPLVDESITSENINYLQIRDLLTELNFTAPCPSTITTIHFTSDVNSISWDDSSISTMLDYHEALNKHRLSQGSSLGIVKNGELHDEKLSTKTLLEDTQDLQPPVWGDYEMDGCVHKICELDVRQILGNSNRAPRWAVAHKFPASSGVTRLQGIEIQVGRTGLLTPVAILDPIDINGVIVQRATLHNFAQMQQILSRKDGDKIENATKSLRVRVGTPVIVRRAGDVIPQVVSSTMMSLESSRNDDAIVENWISLHAPSHCPACGSRVVSDVPITKPKARKSRNESIIEEDEQLYPVEVQNVGRLLRCSAPSLLCPPQANGALQHAFSRDALNIIGLSEARIIQLVDAKIVRFPSDLFDLFDSSNTEKVQNLTGLDKWGVKSVTNLETVVKRVATEGVTLSRFIYSLGIRHVGIHSSTLIATSYNSVDDFIQDLEKAAGSVTETESLEQTDTAISSETVPGMDQKNVQDNSFMRLREQTDSTKGIGPALLSSLSEFACQEQLVQAAKNLAQRVLVLPNKATMTVSSSSSSSNVDSLTPDSLMPLKGQSVVFTGSLPKSISRKQAQEFAISLGATSTPNSISKSTGLLVVGYSSKGDAANTKKREQAKRLGVKIIDGDAFLEMHESIQNK